VRHSRSNSDGPGKSWSQVKAGDNVAITGPGPIGLLALQLAKVGGARVLMIGTGEDAERLKMAKALGADACINVQEIDKVGEATSEFFCTEGAEVVIECSGAAPAAKTLLEVVMRGARFCQMGLYGKPMTFDQDLVCYKELVVIGTNASVPHAWPRALKLLAEKKVNAQGLISHRFAIAEWDKALEVMKSKQGLKILLKP